MLQRDEIVRSADARAAVEDRLLHRGIPQQCLVAVTQLAGRGKTAGGVEVHGIGRVDRAWDMAGNRVDGLVLAAEAVCGARVEKMQVRRAQPGGDLVGGRQPMGARARGKGTRRALFDAAARGATFALPDVPSSIEHSHRVVPQPAQHPPQATGIHPACIVVDYHLYAVIDPPRRQGRRKGIDGWQRVTATPARHNGTREVFVQMRVDGTGNMRGQIVTTAFGRLGECKATVDDSPVRIVYVGGHLGRGDQGRKGHPYLQPSVQKRTHGTSCSQYQCSIYFVNKVDGGSKCAVDIVQRFGYTRNIPANVRAYIF